ncbi:outer membrane protein OmpK [Halomonas binhaiensis]|uniref:DUF5020 family protein n=1 Tax=Halomonas binhaiensis TaxID=2562282 RepID=A0A5C1NJJ7_9GAMM|nr:outer membrane protein OmpK [Halomonas binhaiensis]QEM82813.1 hypothetical protein E4T21_15630 [Halomonas binhaiensis]
MKKASLCLLAGFTALATQNASAAYSTTKVEALYGWDYEDQADAGFGIDNRQHSILTFANASGWTYGDSYFFADFSNYDQNAEDEQDYGSTHAEWIVRGNIGAMTGTDLSFGPIKAVYVAGELDLDRNASVRKTAHLAGLSFDVDVPGLDFFKVHTLYRNDESSAAKGSSQQYTLVWSKQFDIAGQPFSFEGFLDYITEEGDLAKQILTQPQLVWHANDHLGIGIEYQYWQNKFGLEDTDESLPQAMVRWTF